MDQNMRENGKMTYNTGLEKRFGQMGHFILGFLKMGRKMGEVFFNKVQRN
jgi:hypothetical protein